MIPFKKKLFWTFVAGAAAAEGLRKVVKADTTRKLVVKGLAKGMQVSDNIKENVENLKEDAQDVYAEARMTADAEDLIDEVCEECEEEK